MSLQDQLHTDLTAAMKARDAARTSTLRMAKAAIMNKEIDKKGALDANITANYNGDYFFEPDNFLQQKSYVMLNASLRYTLPGDRITLGIFGKNLADERILSQPSTQPAGYPTTYGVPPRTYGVNARIKF